MAKKIKSKSRNEELTIFFDENKEEMLYIMDEQALEEFEKGSEIVEVFEF